jgi:hypothetical protein
MERRVEVVAVVAGDIARHHARMARVVFTQHLRRFTETPEVETTADLLRGALEDAFKVNPRLRGYVLDDQAHLRNVVVFVDGRRCDDRVGLARGLPQAIATTSSTVMDSTWPTTAPR